MNSISTHTGRDVGARPYPIPPADEKVHSNQRIPLPDGIELCADLYVPQSSGPFPAVIEITPYGAQRCSNLGRIYAARGYLFLAVDCRGRYRSAGEWQPLVYDREDGHAVIEWMAAHPLCNGLLGTRGHSYSGSNQLLASIDAPAALRAMVVGVAPGDPFENVPFQGGAYDLNDLFWLFDMTGRVCLPGEDEAPAEEEDDGEGDEQDDEDEEDSPEEQEHDRLIDAALAARPFGELDLRLGIRHEIFREWISHWCLDEYWQARSVGPHLHRSSAAALFISGWWDGNGRGATAFYRGLRERAAEPALRERQRLLIGPWNHDLHAPDCDDLPAHERIAVERGALRDSLNDELAWFDRELKGIEPGPSAAGRVTLYLTGLHRWMDFEDWPPPGNEELVLYLGNTNGGKRGELAREPGDSGPSCSSYTFDPEDPTPYAHDDVDGERIPFDQAEIHAERNDLLLFESEVFESPVALVGEVKVWLHAAADAPDFDLCVKLLDLYPDGRAIYLSDGVLRARFRRDYSHPELVVPGAIEEYAIDLWHLGHLVRKGHRLGVEVASAAFQRFDVNPCTGGTLATETATRKARVSVYHGREHPSRITLPLCVDERLAGEES